MFASKPTPEKSELEKAIDDVLTDMKGFTSETDEYSRMADKLEQLYKLKDIDRPNRVDANTLAAIAANLTGILMIVGHERAHVVGSKAVGFVKKLL